MFKKIFETKKAIIFDLDGTIIDTQTQWAQAVDEILKNMNVDWVDTAGVANKGKTLAAIWEIIQTHYDTNIKMPIPELVNSTNMKFLEIIKENPPVVKDGFYMFAEELKLDHNKKLGLVTNTDKAVVDVLVDMLDMDVIFDATVTVSDVKQAKPNPEMYQKILKLLEVTNLEALAFEDSATGSKAAAEAGIEQIIIWDNETHSKAYSGIIHTFANDFSGFCGNLNKDALDAYTESLKHIQELTKEAQSTTVVS